ncbi:MAG: winged helix-turn-helix transcriptional regulator [Erysipelotrichales bacterium]|nr:winged helix-turn-helix transcriptional regulator [Erysipelotrichales bacterium]
MEYKEIMHLFFKFMHMHRQKVQAYIDEMELYHGQLPILEAVRKNNGCTQTEIAETLHVSAPSIANSIKRLEKNGLIIKEVDPDDNRRSVISITEKGDVVASTCRKKFDEIDEKCFGSLTKDEQKQLYNLLEKMIYNLGREDHE